MTATTPRETGAISRIGRVPALDGIRGIAVAMVVVHHLQIDGVYGAWVSIELFFALSGFLITLSLLLATEGAGVADFFRRRFWRIAPAMTVMLAWFLAVSVNAPDRGRRMENLGASAGQFINIQAAGQRTGPFSEHLGHLWSLSTEAHFYLFWPVLLLVLLRARWPRAAIVLVALGVFAGSTVLRHVLVDGGMQWNRVYFAPDTHGGPLFAGAVLGLLYGWGILERAAVRTMAILLTGPAVVAVVWLVVTPEMYFVLPEGQRWGVTVAALAGVVFVTAAATANGGLLRPLLELRPVAWLGRISYSVYLWHVPFIAELLRARPEISTGAKVAVIVPASLLAGWLSYELVERPFLSSRGRARIWARLGRSRAAVG